jgi:shikimate dehydrogenase
MVDLSLKLPHQEMPPKACIIGDPVAHSRSPLIHEFWLKQLKLQGAYERAHVTPTDLPEFIKNMQKNGYFGANCTIPHKEEVLKLCNNLSKTAADLGAVNTIWFENGELCGDNTDVIGFLSALDHDAPNWDKCTQKAVVIGAGGAARAIVYGLLQRGINQIYVVNRSLERAKELVYDLYSIDFSFVSAGQLLQQGHNEQSKSEMTAISFTDINTVLPNSDLLINTTSLGMKGQPPLEIDLSPLPSSAIINDIVYVPQETPLIKQAKERGLKTVGGLDMLLYQAVSGFERWFGVRPDVTDELRQLIQRDIEG